MGEIADLGGGWRLQVLDYISDATQMIADENQFNEPAPAGMKFAIVRVALGYFGLDDPASGFGPSISAVGSSGVELDTNCGVSPDDLQVYESVYAGGVLTGNLCFVAGDEDRASLQLYASGDMWSGEEVFLSVQTPDSPVSPMSVLPGPQAGASATPARLDPVAVGTSVAIGDGWSMVVNAPARDITAEVLNENMFNEPPAAGAAFLGVDVTLTYEGTETASGFSVTIDAVGGSNVTLSSSCGVTPGEIDLYSDVFAGGRVSGTICFVGQTSDLGSLVLVAYSGYVDANDHRYFGTW